MKRFLLVLALLFAPSVAQAAVSTAAGTLTATAGTTTNLSVGSLGFQPVTFILWTTYPGDAGVAANALSYSFGFATDQGTDQQRAVWSGCTHLDPSECDNRVRDDRVFMIYAGTTPTLICDFTLVSFDSGGFTIDPQTGCTSDTPIYYYAIGGTDITNVAGFTFAIPGATGNFTICASGCDQTATIGFAGNFLLLVGATATAANTNTAGAAFSIGITNGTGAALACNGSSDASAASDNVHYTRFGAAQLELYATCSPDTVNDRISFVSFDSTGITLNAVERASAKLIFGLVIKGGQHQVGNVVTSQTGATGNFDTAASFTGTGLFMMSASRAAQSTSDATNGAAKMSLGFASSSSAHGSAWTGASDGNASNNTYFNLNSSTVNYTSATPATGAVDEEMDFVSFNASTFTLNQTNVAAVAYANPFWLIGSNASASPAGPLRRRNGGF